MIDQSKQCFSFEPKLVLLHMKNVKKFSINASKLFNFPELNKIVKFDTRQMNALPRIVHRETSQQVADYEITNTLARTFLN